MVDQILQMSLPYSENANKQQNASVSQMNSSYFPKENSFEVKDTKEFNKDLSFSKYILIINYY